MSDDQIVTTPTVGGTELFPTSGRISNLDWIRIGRKVRPMSEPFPTTADGVRPWLARVLPAIIEQIAVDLEQILS